MSKREFTYTPSSKPPINRVVLSRKTAKRDAAREWRHGCDDLVTLFADVSKASWVVEKWTQAKEDALDSVFAYLADRPELAATFERFVIANGRTDTDLERHLRREPVPSESPVRLRTRHGRDDEREHA